MNFRLATAFACSTALASPAWAAEAAFEASQIVVTGEKAHAGVASISDTLNYVDAVQSNP